MSASTAMSRTEPGSAGTVKAVSVVSTGTVRIRPEHPYGTRKPLYWWLLTSRRWTPPRPINVYVIEHTKGLILFDTGQDRASVTDGAYFPGGAHRLPVRRLARFDIGERGHPHRPARHARLRPRRRGHRDRVPPARGPHRRAARAGRRRRCWSRPPNGLSWPGPRPELRGFLRSHIQLPGLTWHQVSPEPTGDPALAPFTESLDVMGDGSLMLLPTPGHTAGSVSLLVRRAGRPPLLLAGDVTYGAEILQRGQLPGVGNRRQLAESTPQGPRPGRQQQPGLVVLPAHDPTAAAAAAGQLTRCGRKGMTWRSICGSPCGSATARSGFASGRRTPAARCCCSFRWARACR